MAANNDDATKQIFSRCLLNCLQIPLWYIVCIILFMALAGVLLVMKGRIESDRFTIGENLSHHHLFYSVCFAPLIACTIALA